MFSISPVLAHQVGIGAEVSLLLLILLVFEFLQTGVREEAPQLLIVIVWTLLLCFCRVHFFLFPHPHCLIVA